MNKTRIANRISAVSITVNTVLSLMKLIVGLICRSGALTSDAVHSFSDVLSTFAVIAGVNLSAKAEDKEHRYGHERLESIFSVLLAVFLCGTGLFIGYTGIMHIISGDYKELQIPQQAALFAALISILVKEGMFRYTKKAAKTIQSTALMADAWHHRSDALSSIGSFIGIFGAIIGYPICEPVASVVICLFIIKAAWDIFHSAANELVDKSADDETLNKMKELILSVDGVMGLDMLKTRLFGARIYVDVEIGADASWPLYKAHDVAQRVHDKIENEIPKVKHCMVHVNPKTSEEKESA